MKKLLFLSLCIPLSLSSQVSVRYKERFCKIFIEKYCSDLTPVIQFHRIHFASFCEGNSRMDWINAMPEIIHEGLHQYNDSVNSENASLKTRGYFFDSKVTSVKMGKFFPSASIVNIVSSDVQHNIDRFPIYITGERDGEEDSRKNGIYGLVEEFCAYCNSLKVYVAAYTFMQQNFTPDSTKAWLSYLTDNTSLVTSYYEFKLFIAWYFKRAQQQYPDVYTDLSENHELLSLIRQVDTTFAGVVKQYFLNREEIMRLMNKKVLIKNSYLINISDGLATLLPDAKITYLQQLYEQEK